MQILDKWFKPYITEAEIHEKVKAVAEQITADLKDKNPLFLAVLNGAYIFAADLTRMLNFPMEISFVKLASYQGTMSTGKVREVIGINEDLTGRTVVIIEDIVDTGKSMKQMLESLGTRNPAEVKICALLFKPGKLQEDIHVDYCAMEIPNDFIIGYGLDYDQQGRNLKDIYVIDTSMKNIVIFGGPGSGKGTQSDKIIAEYGLNHISTGDVLRAEIKNETELGKTAKSFIDKGQLIPDDLMIDILAKVYDGFGKEHNGVIFDGFPRTIPQAEALKKMLDERGHKVSAMIELDVPDEELAARLINRGKLSGRSDDNEETIKQRLAVYHNQTSPLADWYEKEGLRNHINGKGAPDDIFKEIKAVIDAL